MPDPIENDQGGGEALTSQQWTEKFNSGGWIEGLPEDISGSPSLSKFIGKPHSEIVKSYINLEKGYGDRIPRPKETFTKKDWDEYNRNYTPGYPNSPEEYKLDLPENTPETYKVSDEEKSQFAKWAHDNGMSQAQTKHMWNNLHSNRIQEHAQTTTQYQEYVQNDHTSLKKEWGAAFAERMNIANAVATKYAPPELMEQLKSQYVSSAVKKMLYNIGKNFKEGTIETGGKPSGVPDPAEAKIKANEAQQKAVEASRKGDRKAVERYTSEAEKYFKMAYPPNK